MSDKTKKFTTPEFFVVLAYCIYLSCEILNYTQFRNLAGWYFIYRIIVLLVASIVIIGIVTKNKQSTKWLILSTSIITVGLLIVIYNDQMMNTAILMLFIVAGSSIHDEKIFRYHWIIVSTLVAFTLLLYAIGVYEPDYIVRTSLTGQTERAYMGFAYTTYPPNYLIHMMFTFYASSKKQIQLRDTIIFLFVNYIFFRFTATYAVFYEVLAFIMVLWILKARPQLFASRLFGTISTLFMPLMTVAAMWLSIIYTPTNSVLFMFNQLMSGRLNQAHIGIIRYGFKLFGNPVEWSAGRYGLERFDEYFYVDSSYVNIALTYGMVALIFIVLCFAILNYKAFKKGNYKLCIIFAFLALHSFTDPQLLELKYNPFLIILLAAFIPSMEKVLTIGLKNETIMNTVKKKKHKIKFKTGLTHIGIRNNW